MPTFPLALPLTHPAYALAASATDERARDPQSLTVAATYARQPADDARAECEVFVRFDQLMAGRMTVVISHRFSTVRTANRIAVLGECRVVEEGTYEELLARGGSYAELFEMQAAGSR